jgi:hypothetical protein
MGLVAVAVFKKRCSGRKCVSANSSRCGCNRDEDARATCKRRA